MEDLYEVETGHCVEDYVTTDRQVLCSLDSSEAGKHTRERLILIQNGNQLDVMLFLDQSLLDHLACQNPLTTLDTGNLAEFWLVLEGVSHFLYLVWNAEYKKSVTQFELELQAEVDKFAMAGSMFTRQRSTIRMQGLHRVLFDVVSYDSSLAQNEIYRYQDANRYAAKFCRHLHRRYRTPQWHRSVLPELRRFYRYSQPDKIRHIETNAIAHC